MYLGTTSGIFKIYPGYQMSPNYEPTSRPWYIKSKTSPNLQATTYIDHLWDTTIVTLSKRIQENNEMLAVVAIDINVKVLKNLMQSLDKDCDKADIECSIVDRYGQFIVHEGRTLNLLTDSEAINIELLKF